MQHNIPIGHLKFLVNGAIKISFTSTTEQAIVLKKQPASSVSLLVNIRVQTTPEIIAGLIAEAINEIEIQSGCKIIVKSHSAFQPGYPRPTHRI